MQKATPDPDYLFSMIPHFWFPKELLWSGGEVQFEGEAEYVIHGTQELQTAFNLWLNLNVRKFEQLKNIIPSQTSLSLSLMDMFQCVVVSSSYLISSLNVHVSRGFILFLTALVWFIQYLLAIPKDTRQKAPHLLHSTEDVCIVLLKATDTGKTGESSRELVAVQHAKISHT